MKLALTENRTAAAADAMVANATAKQPEPLEPLPVASAPRNGRQAQTFEAAMTGAAEAAPTGAEQMLIDAIDARREPPGGQMLKVPRAPASDEHADAEATAPQPLPSAAFIALQATAPITAVPASLSHNSAPRSAMQAAAALHDVAAVAQPAQLLSAPAVAARFLVASRQDTGLVQARALNVAHAAPSLALSDCAVEVATQDTSIATVSAAPLEARATFTPASASTTLHEASTFTTAGAEVLRLPAARPSEWAQPLQQALGDRLRLQLGARSESAVIRLDPPMLGQVEITVRHEAGSIQVQLNATHAEVRQQLQHIGESLRHDLSVRHAGDVSVTVGDGDAKGRERERASRPEDERAPGAGLGDAGTSRHFELSGS